MALVKADSKNIKRAASILKSGGLVAFPTETVYGLGADALNPGAVARIFEVKKRPFFDPIIVHVSSIDEAEGLVLDFGEKGRALAEKFWPGPLTIVLPKNNKVPHIVTAGMETVAVRMPDNEIALRLIREFGGPIAAPSANPFGYISPTSALHVEEQIGRGADMILNGGQCAVGIESTIVRVAGRSVSVLRHGGLPAEDIERVIGRADFDDTRSEKPESPGRLLSHYSPGTPLIVISGPDEIKGETENAGLLAFKPRENRLKFRMVLVLSAGGSLREAAANLFSHLYSLDSAGLSVIYAEAVPEEGLGRAIMERLNKAARRERG